jgi:Uri superfamily endonuclease
MMMNLVKYQMNHTLYAIKGIMTENHNDIRIGKLGTFSFKKGTYVYVGSAKRNIQSRIERHLKIDKKLHWHFDYLRPFLHVVEVETYGRDEGECQLFLRLLQEQNGGIPVQGFGSSDCRCESHLFYNRK